MPITGYCIVLTGDLTTVDRVFGGHYLTVFHCRKPTCGAVRTDHMDVGLRMKKCINVIYANNAFWRKYRNSAIATFLNKTLKLSTVAITETITVHASTIDYLTK